MSYLYMKINPHVKIYIERSCGEGHPRASGIRVREDAAFYRIKPHFIVAMRDCVPEGSFPTKGHVCFLGCGWQEGRQGGRQGQGEVAGAWTNDRNLKS